MTLKISMLFVFSSLALFTVIMIRLRGAGVRFIWCIKINIDVFYIKWKCIPIIINRPTFSHYAQKHTIRSQIHDTLIHHSLNSFRRTSTESILNEIKTKHNRQTCRIWTSLMCRFLYVREMHDRNSKENLECEREREKAHTVMQRFLFCFSKTGKKCKQQT